MIVESCWCGVVVKSLLCDLVCVVCSGDFFVVGCMVVWYYGVYVWWCDLSCVGCVFLRCVMCVDVVFLMW